MTFKVITSEAAARDLEAARRWLTQSGSGPRAIARLRTIQAALRNLRRPDITWPMSEHPGVRMRVVEKYVILHSVDEEQAIVRVLRVIGPYQDRARL